MLEMNHHLKYKMQKEILSYIPEICCSFIQGTKMNHMNGTIYTTTKSLKMDSKTPEQGQIESYSKDPNQNQGHNQEEDSNDEEKKYKKDMHGIQNVEDQNESTKEVVVNENNENKHTTQHINEPEEVLLENNNNKNKEIDAPDMKEHDVDNDYKELEYI